MNEDELREFMGEMREFKRRTLARLSSVESKVGVCQTEPGVCSTARAIDGHLRNHRSDSARRVSVAAACISGIACAISLIGIIARRG
jgi:hypothetical protein